MLAHHRKICTNTSWNSTHVNVQIESSPGPSAQKNTMTHLSEMCSFLGMLRATTENPNWKKQSWGEPDWLRFMPTTMAGGWDGIWNRSTGCSLCWTLSQYYKYTKSSEISQGKMSLCKSKNGWLGWVSGSDMMTSQSLCFETNLF